MFRLQHGVAFGEQVKVVGDGAELGNWEIENAPTMRWGEGDNWSLDLDMPGGSYDFKFVVQSDSAEAEASEWEAGANRFLFIPNMPTSSAIAINGSWSDTTSTFLSMSLDDDDDELEDIWAKALKGAQANKDADALAQRAPLRGRERPSASSVGASADEPVQPGASGEKRPIAEPEELPPATGLAGFTSSDSSSDADDAGGGGDGGDPGSGEHGGTADGSAGSKPPTSQADSPDSGPQSPLEFAVAPVAEAADAAVTKVAQSAMDSVVAPRVKSQGASAGELAAGFGGLGAAGIVAWSLATLRTTGCGLPPGPGGVLGGLEGVSYLAVTGLAGWGLRKRLRRRTSGAAGPGLLLGLAEGAALTTAAAGIVVLALQVSERGFVPSALPDANCYGEGSSNAAQVSSRS